MSMGERSSKYIEAVRHYMGEAGHATHTELLTSLHERYPEVSATTVHRITTRMVERSELQMAPSSKENVMRFDANLTLHDHFMCDICGTLKDATLDESVRPLLEEAIGDGCSISGSLTVSGICKKCKKEQR